MTQRQAKRNAVEVTHVGEHFALGRTRDFGGIWTKDAVGRRRPGPPIEGFPRTDEGERAASERFSTWEPNARPVGPLAPTSTNHRGLYRVLAAALVVIIAGVTGAAIAAGRSGSNHTSTAAHSLTRIFQ